MIRDSFRKTKVKFELIKLDEKDPRLDKKDSTEFCIDFATFSETKAEIRDDYVTTCAEIWTSFGSFLQHNLSMGHDNIFSGLHEYIHLERPFEETFKLLEVFCQDWQNITEKETKIINDAVEILRRLSVT